MIIICPKCGHDFNSTDSSKLTIFGIQVGKLLCQGLNNRAIAEKLKIRERTVKAHVRNLQNFFQVKGRVAIAVRFTLHQQKSKQSEQ